MLDRRNKNYTNKRKTFKCTKRVDHYAPQCLGKRKRGKKMIKFLEEQEFLVEEPLYFLCNRIIV
jgi:hypothetical protein